MRIRRIFLHQRAQQSNLAVRVCQAFPNAAVQIVRAESEVRQHVTGPDKHMVYVGPRSAPFVSRFEPPAGMVCSRFWKFTSETECLYDCHYCYLALTMRILPYLRLASNIEKGLDELERVLHREATTGCKIMFNVGELADGRLLDPITELSKHLLPVFHKYPNGMLHVLTKSGTGTIGAYLQLAHLAPGRVIHVVSVNPQLVIDLTENDTPPVADRLMALGQLQRAGYRIRLRVDPIFDLRDFGYEEMDAHRTYKDLIDMIATYCIPELITLGSYRPDHRLIPHLRRRHPNSPVLQVHTCPDSHKRRVPTREALYRHIVTHLRQRFPGVAIALCKEPIKMWRDVGLSPKPLQCSCRPLISDHQDATLLQPFELSPYRQPIPVSYEIAP
jgi:DNA repair photolyase